MSVQAIILAAGKGTRLAGMFNEPKALLPLSGKPVIQYILDTLHSLHIPSIIIVGYKKEMLIKKLGTQYTYVTQIEKQGTAAAVSSAIPSLRDMSSDSNILVLNSDDSAFLSEKTLQSFINNHIQKKSDITLLTVKKQNPFGLGRIIKKGDKVIAIVEEKDATEKEKKIQEINTGVFCFHLGFLKDALSQIKPSPVTGEYYITDLVKIAVESKKKVQAYELTNDTEIFGFNTPEEYKEAQKRMQKN